jgi:hypothetical protein
LNDITFDTVSAKAYSNLWDLPLSETK